MASKSTRYTRMQVIAMFLPDQVKPLFLHEDRFVRELAADYFNKSSHRDDELLPLVLEASRRYGVGENIRPLQSSTEFPVSVAAVPELLQLLEMCSDADDITRFCRILVHAPAHVLNVHSAAIQSSSNIPQETRERLRQRIELAGWSGSALWEELQRFSRSADEDETSNAIDAGYVDDLIAALQPADLPDTATICKLLSSYTADEGDWLETFLVSLVGVRRVREAAPILVEKLTYEGDYLVGATIDALCQIADESILPLIQAKWTGASWSFRLFAYTVIQAVGTPAAEELLLSLLESETDLSLRTAVCTKLCHMISERGVEQVQKQINRGYDSMYSNLHDELVPVATVLGINLPDLAVRHANRMARENDINSRLKAMGGPVHHSEFVLPEDELPPGDSSFFDKGVGLKQFAGVPQPATPANEPIRHFEPRVGRNDPCPCGSGKKFKKCCGRT